MILKEDTRRVRWKSIALITLFLIGVRALIGQGAQAAPAQQAYLKASNTGSSDVFGKSPRLSGETLVIGAFLEDSNAIGVNGDQNNNSVQDAGAAYVFVRDGTNWLQQAYLKASNTGAPSFGEGDQFGFSVAVSGDTAVVGAPYEDSIARGVNGNQNNNDLQDSGAAYVFVRNGTNWSQQAYLKSSDNGFSLRFGHAVAVSGDTVVVGRAFGGAFVFVRDGTNWTQQARPLPSNDGPNQFFGYSVALSGDTLVVGAYGESSSASGVNGDGSGTSAPQSGAAYVFVRNGTNWTQEAYLKASNSGASDFFGTSVAVWGDTVVVGANRESSSSTGVNGDQSDNSSPRAGAAYVFVRSGTNWSQQAYLKASNTGASDEFGSSVAVHGDTVVVGARMEASSTAGINGDGNNNLATNSGAAYVFVRTGTNWTQHAYLKASNTGANDFFGGSVAVFGETVVVGAQVEDSNAKGVNGDQTNNSAPDSGAAYIFTGFCPACPKLTLVPDGTGGFFIRFTGAPDVAYRLQRALNVTGPWDTVATLTAPHSGLLEVHDAPPPPSQAFYRAVQP